MKLKITGPKLTISYKPVKCIVEDKKMITCYPGALVVKKEPGVIEKPSKYTSTTFKDRCAAPLLSSHSAKYTPAGRPLLVA